MHRICSGGSAAAGFVASSQRSAARPRSQPIAAKVGTLNCDVSGGIGIDHRVAEGRCSCLFKPDRCRGPPETLYGTISKFGLDIGATPASQMVWAVFAGGSAAAASLAGSYAGATAEATVAVGLGANVLVGGSDRSVALQPFSVTGQTG